MAKKLPTEARSILLSSATGQEALTRLFAAKRVENPRFSLAALASASGIASKGYLSEVMRAKRPLGEAHVAAVARALGLDGLGAKYLATLLRLDREESSDDRARLAADLEAMRRALTAPAGPMPDRLGLDLFAIEVFCATGLFGGEPRREDLVSYFGRERAFEVDRALATLAAAGYVEKQEERWVLRRRNLSFSDEEGAASHLRFLQDAITDAAKVAGKWYPRKAEAHFESIIISVDDGAYRRLLARLKDDLLKWQAELETERANRLVRFNVQIYPLD